MVGYYIKLYGTFMRTKESGRGWKELVEDNKLGVGDASVFQQMKSGSQVSFKITIFKAADHQASNPCSRVKYKCGGKLDFSNVKSPQHGSGSASKYPFFQATITESSLSRKRLIIPMSFVKSNLNKKFKKRILTIETGGSRSWRVTRCYYLPCSNYVCGGFSCFLKENFVKVGDFCTFELGDRKRMVFRVYIHKGYEIPLSNNNNLCSNQPNSSKRSDAPQPGSKFASKYPLFQANLTTYYFSGGVLNVTWTFVKGNMNTEIKHQIVTLETGSGQYVAGEASNFQLHKKKYYDG